MARADVPALGSWQAAPPEACILRGLLEGVHPTALQHAERALVHCAHEVLRV